MSPEQIRGERERMQVTDPVAFFVAELAAQFAEYNRYQKTHLEFMRSVEEKQLQLCEEEAEQSKEAQEFALGTVAQLIPQPGGSVAVPPLRPARRHRGN